MFAITSLALFIGLSGDSSSPPLLLERELSILFLCFFDRFPPSSSLSSLPNASRTMRLFLCTTSSPEDLEPERERDLERGDLEPDLTEPDLAEPERDLDLDLDPPDDLDRLVEPEVILFRDFRTMGEPEFDRERFTCDPASDRDLDREPDLDLDREPDLDLRPRDPDFDLEPECDLEREPLIDLERDLDPDPDLDLDLEAEPFLADAAGDPDLDLVTDRDLGDDISLTDSASESTIDFRSSTSLSLSD